MSVMSEAKEMPLGLMYAMAQNKHAMQTFASMSDAEQEKVIDRAKRAKTKADMQLIVQSLTDSVGAVEYS